MATTYESIIEQVAQDVFATMLNIDLLRLDRPDSSCPNELVATVSIVGAWTGKVVLALARTAASAAAAAMLQVPVDEVTDTDAQDVASELVNMIGGNLKSLLPGPSYLSLPTIISGRDIGLHMHDAVMVDDVLLACESAPVRIGLYEKRNP